MNRQSVNAISTSTGTLIPVSVIDTDHYCTSTITTATPPPSAPPLTPTYHNHRTSTTTAATASYLNRPPPSVAIKQLNRSYSNHSQLQPQQQQQQRLSNVSSLPPNYSDIISIHSTNSTHNNHCHSNNNNNNNSNSNHNNNRDSFSINMSTADQQDVIDRYCSSLKGKDQQPSSFKTYFGLPFSICTWKQLAYLILGFPIFLLISIWTLLSIVFVLVPPLNCLMAGKVFRSWKRIAYHELKVINWLFVRGSSSSSKLPLNRYHTTRSTHSTSSTHNNHNGNNGSGSYGAGGTSMGDSFNEKLEYGSAWVLCKRVATWKTFLYLVSIQISWKLVTLLLFIVIFLISCFCLANSAIIWLCGQKCYDWIPLIEYPAVTTENIFTSEYNSKYGSEVDFVHLILANAWGSLILIPAGVALLFSSFILLYSMMRMLQKTAISFLVDK